MGIPFLTFRKALQWIHGCGWVHRDLSVSNLYLYEGRGLIGDFEYAKHRDDDTYHEVRSVRVKASRVLLVSHTFSGRNRLRV